MIRNILQYTLVSSLLFLFIACGSNAQKTDTTTTKNEGIDIELTPISSGYFLKNDVALGEGVNYMVATKETSFTNNFGYGAVMGESHEHPDFNTSIILAVAVNIKDKISEPSIVHAKLVDSNLNVFCNNKILEEEATYKSTPIALAQIKRDARIKTVSFYDGETLVRRVNVD